MSVEWVELNISETLTTDFNAHGYVVFVDGATIADPNSGVAGYYFGTGNTIAYDVGSSYASYTTEDTVDQATVGQKLSDAAFQQEVDQGVIPAGTYSVPGFRNYYADEFNFPIEYYTTQTETLAPFTTLDGTVTPTYASQVWAEINTTGYIFTNLADSVDFNKLTVSQQNAIDNGANVYNGLGGSDNVELPSVANYNEEVGSGDVLGWNDQQTFGTESQPGDVYKISGSDGNYNLQLGTGNDEVTINGNGSSTITGGGGTGDVTINGSGSNTINAGNGTGTVNVTLTGEGHNTFISGGSAFGKVSLGQSDDLTVNGFTTIQDLVDNGGVEAANYLTVSGSLNGSGKISIDNSAVLEVDHFTAAASPTIAFQDGTGKLIIDANGQADPSGISLLNLENLQKGDVVDIENFNANYASVLPEVTDGVLGNSTLYVSNNDGKVLQFGLSNIQANTSFTLSADGTGGTLLTSTEQPSILDLAELSNDVYSPKGISGWNLIAETGYDGVAAYSDPDASQIVIAVKGTDSFKDILSDVVSIGTGLVIPSFSNLVTQATNLYNAIKSQFASAALTLTGHSLGGGVAELLGEATGVSTDVFNAPGVAQIFDTVEDEGLLPTALSATANYGPVVNYREPSDWVSATGVQVGSTETIEASSQSLSPITSHKISTITTDLNQASTTIKDGYNGFYLPIASISNIVIPNLVLSVAQIAVATAGYVVDSTLTAFIDPEKGTFFTYSQDENSPQITSVQFLDNGEASYYKVWTNPYDKNSMYTVASPAQTVSFASGVESFGFEALDANGNEAVLDDGFLFNATYASAGNVNATIDSSDTAFFPAAVCFASGTQIRTLRGDVPVEDLVVGDLALTNSGDERPVRWIGHRTLDCRKHPRPHEAMPIRIAAHAFGENHPARDLVVSPGHAICIDVLGEMLIPAAALVNNATIQQIEVDAVTYWHIELDSHDVIMAENLPAESYLDMGNRKFFAEADIVGLAAGPDTDPTMRTHLDFCRPFVASGAVLNGVRAQLRRHAEHQGWFTSRDLDLYLVVDGRRVDPTVRGLQVRFQLPAEAKDVLLMSPTARPCDAIDSCDSRELGLPIGGLRIVDGFDVRVIAIDDPRFSIGFHGIEDGTLRWTSGRAWLPAELWEGCEGSFYLLIDLVGMPVPRWIAPEGAFTSALAA